MDDEQVEGDGGNRRLDPDLAGMEPVRQLAAIEQQLQRADADAEAGKAEKVEQLAMGRPSVVDEDEDAERGDDPDRQVDVEHPAPAVILGQPAAQGRPHDRAEDDPAAPHRHRLAVPLRWVDLEQHRLRLRHQAEARVNPATEIRNTYLMPKCPASQPVSGIMMAAETM